MNIDITTRRLKNLDALEIRVKQTVNPSKILLAEIHKQRHELLNPPEIKDATTKP